MAAADCGRSGGVGGGWDAMAIQQSQVGAVAVVVDAVSAWTRHLPGDSAPPVTTDIASPIGMIWRGCGFSLEMKLQPPNNARIWAVNQIPR